MFKMSKTDRKIANLNQMVINRDEVIGRLQAQKDDLKAENKILIKENQIGNKAIIVLDELNKLINCNKYSNNEIIFRKIKELVTDYQSIN